MWAAASLARPGEQLAMAPPDPPAAPASTTAVSRLSFSSGKRRSNTVAALLSVIWTNARRPIHCTTITAQHDGDNAEHGHADNGRRLEEPIDAERGPKRRAQPRHRGATALAARHTGAGGSAVSRVRPRWREPGAIDRRCRWWPWGLISPLPHAGEGPGVKAACATGFRLPLPSP